MSDLQRKDSQHTLVSPEVGDPEDLEKANGGVHGGKVHRSLQDEGGSKRVSEQEKKLMETVENIPKNNLLIVMPA